MVSNDNPDRSEHYKLEDPEDLTVINTRTGGRQKLLDQVNENFRQMRLLKAALDDRNQVIAELHGSIKTRDELIASLETKIRLFNRVRPFVYAAIGSAITASTGILINFLVLGHR